MRPAPLLPASRSTKTISYSRTGRAKAFLHLPLGYTTHTFLTFPLGTAAFNILLAVLLSRISYDALEESVANSLLQRGQSMGNLVASTSMTILTLTFSLTFLSIQIAAQTYSPRLLDGFIKDPVSKISIAVNVGAFTYAYTMSFYLYPHDDAPILVPAVAIHFLSAQMAFVIIMFIMFIHYFVNGFRLECILQKAMESSWAAARTLEHQNRDSLGMDGSGSLLDASQQQQQRPGGAMVAESRTSATAVGRQARTLLDAARSTYATAAASVAAIGLGSSHMDGNENDNDNIESLDKNGNESQDPLTEDDVKQKQQEQWKTVQVPKSAYRVLADSSGYVAAYTLHRIFKQCVEKDVCVRYHAHIGEFVAEGTVLAYVWDASSSRDDGGTRSVRPKSNGTATQPQIQSRFLEPSSVRSEREVEEVLGQLVADGVIISPIRSGVLDITLGIQQIVDIAVRALSAAINDPHTAIQAIDALSALFGRLAHLDFYPTVLVEKRKNQNLVRLSSPRRSFTYLLSIMDSIRHYGCGDLFVMYRLIRFYGDLGASVKRLQTKHQDRISPILAQLEQCIVFCKRNFEPNSLEMKSVQELYEYALDVMAVSDRVVMNVDDESVEDDLQDLETTYACATTDFMASVPQSVWGDVTTVSSSSHLASSGSSERLASSSSHRLVVESLKEETPSTTSPSSQHDSKNTSQADASAN